MRKHNNALVDKQIGRVRRIGGIRIMVTMKLTTMRKILGVFVAALCCMNATQVVAETLMLQIHVDEMQEHQFQRSWIESRTVQPESVGNGAESVLLVEAFDETAQVIAQYLLEDHWSRINNMPAYERVDMKAPENYIVRLVEPKHIQRVVISRVADNSDTNAAETLLSIDRDW